MTCYKEIIDSEGFSSVRQFISYLIKNKMCDAINIQWDKDKKTIVSMTPLIEVNPERANIILDDAKTFECVQNLLIMKELI